MHIIINGSRHALPDANNITVQALVETLNIANKRIAVERNGEIVPRSQFAVTLLQEGDALEIVGAVGGG